jgi:hypothetical protein
VNEPGGRDHDGRDATEPDDAHASVPHFTGWSAPIIDAPVASGAADTEPATPVASWGDDDDWAWTYADDFGAAIPDVHQSGADESPTSPGVPAIPASAIAAHEDQGMSSNGGAGRSRNRRRTAIGFAALACFAILVGALAGTMDGGGTNEPKRADTAPVTTTVAPTTTTSTTPVTTLVLPPTTVLSSATVVTRPPVVAPVATSPPPACNIVTQLLGCH